MRHDRHRHGVYYKRKTIKLLEPLQPGVASDEKSLIGRFDIYGLVIGGAWLRAFLVFIMICRSESRSPPR